MPSRILREGLIDSDRVGRVSVEAEVLFIRLMLLADDFGRYDGRLPVICRRAFVNRREITEQETAVWLDQLAREGLVLLYEVDGKPYLQIQNFRQRNRSRQSKYPAPEGELLQSLNQRVDGHLPDICPSDVGHARTETESESETEEKRSASDEADHCPHEAIIALYHDILPMCPAVQVWNEERRSLLRTRWREDTERQNLSWWREFLQGVRESDFLTGRAQSRDRAPFVATLEWLIRPRNFVKVIEGQYANRRGAAEKLVYATTQH